MNGKISKLKKKKLNNAIYGCIIECENFIFSSMFLKLYHKIFKKKNCILFLLYIENGLEF